ncbi:MAG: RagB/SusD family nutrient uptake outer membrane protein [Bacteroidales bacterium]|nr:RagB/SusD family nutrient uptake outer membrane protein [Bacteroidales bacterium]
MRKTVYMILVAASLCAVGCVNLDTASKNAIMSGNMWQTEALVDAGVAGIMGVFYGDPDSGFSIYPGVETAVSHSRIEVCGFTSQEQAHASYMCSSTYSAGDGFMSLEWKYCYEGISRANDAIYHLKDVTCISDSKKATMIARCKFLRAWFYARLNMLYDGVPVYLEPVTVSECTKGRSTPEQVWKVVLDDLGDCIESKALPDNSLAASDYGAPSNGAVYALRGMAYMWMKDYEKAAADLAKVKQCGYGLFSGEYEDIFKEENEKNVEMVFPIQYFNRTGYSDVFTHQCFGNRSTLAAVNFIFPSTEFVDSYQRADGSKFEWSQVFPEWDMLSPVQREVFFVRDGMNSATTIDFTGPRTEIINRVGQMVWDTYYLNEGNQARLEKAYSCRDPRLRQTVFTPGSVTRTCALMGGSVSTKTFLWPYIIPGNTNEDGDLWSDSRTNFYYMYKKFVVLDDPSFVRNLLGRDWPLIRFTDVYLLLAEALNEIDRSNEAVSIVNEIRARAHMPLLNDGSEANTVKGKDDLRERIRYERRVELCGEGVNYFDEVRWGTLRQTKFMDQEQHGVCNMWGRRTGNIQYFRNNGWPWAVPRSEWQRNNNLRPTPGWSY